MPSTETYASDSPNTASVRVTELGPFGHYEPADIDPIDENHGEAARPRWARPALLALLVATAASYLWNLSASGFGNSFYAAAVEAGSKSWKAMLFGSIDSSNFITVDKPPAALWVMDLSARIFGFSTWSVMVPNVLEGVLAVALLYAAVRRVSNDAAGLVAGAVLAITPAAALMFRFDNPDAFLVLLMVAAGYCLIRALERARSAWLVGVGILIGFAFLTKMMQGLIVVPAFGLAYLVAAPTSLRRRLLQLVYGLVAMVAAAGWWLAIVSLVPASDRPFIDGSPDNSIWNLIFEYNGFGRIVSSGSGGGGGGNFSGAPGLLRLFNDLMGGQASWLLPAALLSIVVIGATRWRAPRTDIVRAAGIAWGGWLLVTAAVFSLGQGVIHTYYTVALAPAIAALVGIAGHQLWLVRHRLWARLVTAGAIALTAVWSFALLDRTPSWSPWLRWLVLVTGLAATVGIVVAGRSARRVVLGSLATLAGVAALAGPLAYTTATIASAHTGSIPTAGPSTGTTGLGGPGGGPGQGTRGGFPGRAVAGSNSVSDTGSSSAGQRPPSGTGTSATGRSHDGFPGDGALSHSSFSSSAPTASGSAPSGPASGSGSGGAGGGRVSPALARYLEKDASHYTWIAAVDGSSTAASLELASGGDAVMAIGGFNGNGGNLSLTAFEHYVKDGDIHYFVSGGGGGGGPEGSSTSAITQWVEQHYKSVTVGGETIYILTSAKS